MPQTNTDRGRPGTIVPRATYRLQFHRGFTLRDAIKLIPYLSELGVSHVYASPLLKARPGSPHGYDVCDCSQLNPEIGSEAELESFVAALRRHGMGLVLDIVPNHMAAGPENPWWWDVLKHGRTSRYAGYFDIEWDPPDPRLHGKVLVPVLGDEYERVLEKGGFTVRVEDGAPVLRYFEHRFPLAPESLPAPTAKLTELNARPDQLDALLQQQHYRPTFWRRGDAQLNYRRFFNITMLAGLRVEDEQVFGDAHARILDWYQRGHLDGVRVDHPDGLRDPQQYLERLRQAAPKAWVVVEKILEPGEELPRDWPVAGTTGYDFLNRVVGPFLDPAGEKPLTEFYAEFTGAPTDYAAVVREKKQLVLHELLPAEVDCLSHMLQRLAARRGHSFTLDGLRGALVELVACFPVYRTYIQAGSRHVSGTDTAHIDSAVAAARNQGPDGNVALLDFLGDLLRLRQPGELEADFVMRFQQLTGPAMAKGVEDTTFYCFNRFVALNEVGGDPGHFGLGLEAFHRTCRGAQAQWPDAMLATSTHDTKRSEDIRARLSLLSEIPKAWRSAVLRWSALNEKHRRDGWPDRNAEYLYYQTLVGAWPLPLDRALAYMEKASCEAKEHTTWTDRNPAYDEALKHFVTSTLDEAEFTADLERFVAPLVEPGHINSLAQTLVKLTAPGVPDIYQGTELWDFSLVDPDNRRPVDFETRRHLLAGLAHLPVEEIWQRRGEGLPKLWLIQKTLGFRRNHPGLFGSDSSYEPLNAQGGKADHVLGFVRGGRVVTVVPRLIMGLADDWADTVIELPQGVWRNELTGESISGGACRPADLLKRFPVALLVRKEND